MEAIGSIYSAFHRYTTTTTLVPDIKTSFFFFRIPYFFENSPLNNGDVLWGRFDQYFFRVWGRFDQIGDVMTRGRFD